MALGKCSHAVLLLCFCSLTANWNTTVESKGNKREMDPERTRRMRTKQAKKMVMSQRLLAKAGLPDYFHTEDNYASINCHFPLKNWCFINYKLSSGNSSLPHVRKSHRMYLIQRENGCYYIAQTSLRYIVHIVGEFCINLKHSDVKNTKLFGLQKKSQWDLFWCMTVSVLNRDD